MVEKQSSLQSGVPAVQDYCAGEKAERLTLLYGNLTEQLVQESLNEDPKRNDGGHTEGQLCRLVG